jgi:hypothetical protein
MLLHANAASSLKKRLLLCQPRPRRVRRCARTLGPPRAMSVPASRSSHAYQPKRCLSQWRVTAARCASTSSCIAVPPSVAPTRGVAEHRRQAVTVRRSERLGSARRRAVSKRSGAITKKGVTSAVTWPPARRAGCRRTPRWREPVAPAAGRAYADPCERAPPCPARGGTGLQRPDPCLRRPRSVAVLLPSLRVRLTRSGGTSYGDI